MRKFWERRLEEDVKNLKKSAWNVLSLIIYKYGYKDLIQTRGMGSVDIAIQIIENKDIWDKLTENEKYYVSGLLGKDTTGGSE